MIDSGVGLFALGVGNEQGLGLAVLCLLVRPFGVALMAAGLKGLVGGRGAGRGMLKGLEGRGRRLPWSTVCFMAGALSLAGLPVSAGFAGRWALYRLLTVSDFAVVAGMTGASLGLMVGVWRGLSALLGGGSAPAAPEKEAVDEHDGWSGAVIAALVVAASVVLGLSPQILTPVAARLAGLYTFMVR